MDWNWFFSSVAQSAAAIVGILAAFIITKILNSQTEYNHNLNEIINIKNESGLNGPVTHTFPCNH